MTLSRTIKDKIWLLTITKYSHTSAWHLLPAVHLVFEPMPTARYITADIQFLCITAYISFGYRSKTIL